MLKDEMTKILTLQISIGQELKKEIDEASNFNQIEAVKTKYNNWDQENNYILKDGFVQSQLYRMYSGVTYLSNVYVDPKSFQNQRDELDYCLPRKLGHLNTALNNLAMVGNKDLLPLSKLSSKKNTSVNMNVKKLFISHSFKDKDIIKPFVDLIEGVGLSHKQIFFSSDPSYGVSLGENIFERLKKELTDEVFALFILSDNFYKSPVCLCEMGAVWIKTNKQIPVLIPPFDFSGMQGVFPNSLGFKINDKAQLNSFKADLESYFNIDPIPYNRWEEKRDEFLVKVNSLINKPI